MLSQFYPPFIGGEEQFVSTLSAELAARSHEVAVATIWHDGLADYEVLRGVEVYRLRSTAQRARWLYSDLDRSHAAPVPDPELSLGIRRVIRQFHPEIIHAHNWMVRSFLPFKTRHNRLVVSLHDYSFRCATKKLLFMDESICSGPGPHKCIKCAVHHYGRFTGPLTVVGNWSAAAVERRLVDAFVPVSQSTAIGNGLVDLHACLRVIPNFVADENCESSSVAEYMSQLPPDGFILFVGALGTYKGINVLLRAYAGIPDPPPLVLVGYSVSEFPLETATLPAGVTILSNWPHEAVMHAWRRSAFGVIPSLVAEAFPLTALEAMVSGRPVIASDIGGLTEIVRHGETGLLVPPGDGDGLRLAMQRLLQDEPLRKSFGIAGQKRAEEYRASRIVPRFEALYRRLISPPATASI